MNSMLRIRTLTDRFFDGDTTQEEEQELYDFFRQDDIPLDLRPLQELFRDLAVLPGLKAEAERLQGGRHGSGTRLGRGFRWWLSAAAAVLIVGGVIVWRVGTAPATTGQDQHQHEDECVAYVYGQRVTDPNVVLSEMQKTMTAMTTDGSDVVEEQLKAMFSN